MSQLIKPTDKEWREWEEICDYTGWNTHGKLKPMKYHGKIIPYSKAIGTGPTFLNELMEKIKTIKPIRIAIVGEAGISKTYTAIEIARTIDKKFTVDQVVLSAKGYMKLTRTLNPGQCIVLDEPTFHLAARTWFKEWQRIIVQTIESTRFQNNPLLIPVVNLNLVDKTVRDYYVNYVVNMFHRGFGRVYRTKHSQWEDKQMKRTAFNIYIYTPGVELSRCGRITCLQCVALPTCDKYIWPQYERKRAVVIQEYQKKGEEIIAKADRRPINFPDMCKLADLERESLKSLDKKIYALDKIMLRFEIGVTIARQVKAHLDNIYPINLKKPEE